MSSGDSEGPAWNKFWLSLDNESDSMVSGDQSRTHATHTPDARSLMSPDLHRPGLMERGDSVLPTDSASHTGADSPEPELSAAHGATPISLEDTPFAFKFKSPSGRVHRLQVTASAGLEQLISTVAEKLGHEAESIGGVPTFEDSKLSQTGFALSYMDNEGDTVSITTDHDLLEAISIARSSHRDKVDLFVHDPTQPAHTATVDPAPQLPPPVESQPGLRERRRQVDDDDDEEEETDRRRRERKAASQPKQEEQLIQGVPNELLLPGAIVTLAVVIVGVFVISRSTSR
ncbi:MAG: hypothetical protein M1822_001242 [Bathelium mastoideum]|nr:MAG: hypothetical protein M1822_001242 [Bathelium mastoideum]